MNDAPISEAELAAIERRAAAASPAPWKSWIEGRDFLAGSTFIELNDADGDQVDLYLSVDGPHGLSAVASDADHDFIAHARQDIPRLIAEIRRLRG